MQVEQSVRQRLFEARLLSFIELNRKILNLLYQNDEVREIEMDTLSFNSALISAEFNLLEEGTQTVFCIESRVC